MRDPFFLPPIPWLSAAVQPLARSLHWTTLPLHIHEVLFSLALYTFVEVYASPRISTWLFPVKYPRLSADKRKNWDVHAVSLTQSVIVSSLALYVMYADEERGAMDWYQRVWGYDGAMGLVQGFATGYFLWDLIVTLRHYRLFGPGMLAHAVAALLVFSLGFRPFVNFYGCTFILYELSSPFLNIHWFFDKLDLTGSLGQLLNGILLLITFAGCRLVWGTYQSVRIYQDMWRALQHDPATAHVHYDTLQSNSAAAQAAREGKSAVPLHDDVMRFAGDEYIPLWVALSYLFSNLILNTLNFYWFSKMIETLRKRFEPEVVEKDAKSPTVTRHEEKDGRVKIDIDETEVRRRKGAKGEVPPPT